MGPFTGLGEEEIRLFLDETAELLDGLEQDLLQLERGARDPDLVARVFRAAHTIKGSAATVGLEGMARLTHAMENLFERVREGSLAPGEAEVSALLAAVDALRAMLAEAAAGRTPPDPPAGLLRAVEEAAGVRGGGQPAAVAAGPSAPALSPPGAAAGAEEPPAPPRRGLGGTVPGADAVVRAVLDPACPMPAVRALQVLLALEPLGEILASDPSREEIEAERVGTAIAVWLRTGAPREAIADAVRGVPDLVRVAVEAPAAAAGPGHADGRPGPGPHAAGAGAQPGAARHGDDRTIRVDVELLDRLMNLVGELVIDRGRLIGLGQRLLLRPGAQDLAEELGRVVAHLGRVTGTLQEAVLKARMLPIERVFRKFPRMVRDLAAQLGKEVELELVGEDTELDRSLLEVIADPLVHLVRNALDHGIEPPAERLRLGKPRAGRLRLAAAHEDNHVVVRVEDDGRGIDAERVREAAVRRGLLTRERARELPDRDAMQLLFLPGFSTAERVSDISGRGVGLDVVRKNIEGVGGRIELESAPGRGTAFVLVLPLTLATIRALLVQAGEAVYALPLGTVAEVLHVQPRDVASVKGRRVTRVRGRLVPLLWLQRYAEPGFVPPSPASPLLAVLVHHKGDLVGLVVDRLLGEQEVVVKGLGEVFGSVRGLSGVTILGDGSLALILDVTGVVAVLAAEHAPPPPPGDGDAVPAGAGARA